MLPRLNYDLAMALSGDAVWIAPPGEARPICVPAYVAVAAATGAVVAVGTAAAAINGNEPGSIAVLRWHEAAAATDDGTVLATAMRELLREHGRRGVRRARIVFVVEAGLRLAVKTALLAAGAREVLLLDPPMAAAIGIGLKIEVAAPSAVLVLERRACSFAVISLAGVVAGFTAAQGLGRLLEDIALHAQATRGCTVGVERVHDAILRHGLAGAEAIGWEAWLDEVATGRSATASFADPDIRRISEPFRHWLAWHHRGAFESIAPGKRAGTEAIPVHLVGPYARAAGLADLVGLALDRRVVVPENHAACLVQGARAVTRDLPFLLSFVSRHQRRRA